MTGVDRLRTHLAELAGDQAAVNAPQPASDSIAGFQHHDIVAGVATTLRSYQSGKSGANDHHSHRAFTEQACPSFRPRTKAPWADGLTALAGSLAVAQ